MTANILIVDDCPIFSESLRQALMPTYQAVTAESAEKALHLLNTIRFDLLILDLGLPGMDGHRLCTHLKSDGNLSDIPILILSGRSEIEEKLLSFSLGVQDFLVKPIDSRELKSRIQIQLKQNDKLPREDHCFQIGPFEGDRIRQHLSYWLQGEKHEMPLSHLEFKLLHFFLTHIEHVLSREQLLNEVWGRSRHVSDRSVDVSICKLRQKLGPYASLLRSVHGAGYKFLRPSASLLVKF